MRVARIELRQPGGDPSAEGVKTGAPLRLDRKAVHNEDVPESGERQQVDVLQRLLLDRLTACSAQGFPIGRRLEMLVAENGW
jgi:hypothetical protein